MPFRRRYGRDHIFSFGTIFAGSSASVDHCVSPFSVLVLRELYGCSGTKIIGIGRIVSGKRGSHYQLPAGRGKNPAMKQHRVPRRRRAPRAQLLTAIDRSGLSAAAFARQQGVPYTTFCGWRRRRDQGQSVPGFVQVETPESTRPGGTGDRMGWTAGMRLTSEAQIPLAVKGR